MSRPYNTLLAYGTQARGCAVTTCGPHTGHMATAIAYCDSPGTAATLAAVSSVTASLDLILTIIGNVDHSTGDGPNAAAMRGGMLNDIREIAQQAITRATTTAEGVA